MGMMFRRNKLRRREMEQATVEQPKPVPEKMPAESVKDDKPAPIKRGRKPKK